MDKLTFLKNKDISCYQGVNKNKIRKDFIFNKIKYETEYDSFYKCWTIKINGIFKGFIKGDSRISARNIIKAFKEIKNETS